eukprot:SAG25_NODE_245_length_11100_cov_4.621671_12_plen_89_part_00
MVEELVAASAVASAAASAVGLVVTEQAQKKSWQSAGYNSPSWILANYSFLGFRSSTTLESRYHRCHRRMVGNDIHGKIYHRRHLPIKL